MSISEEVTGLILAGGLSRRFGRYKCLEDIDLRPMVFRVIDIFRVSIIATKRIYGETLHNAISSYNRDVVIVYDNAMDYNPINGIRAGIRYVDTYWVFIAGCDYPYIRAELVNYICSKGFDASIPYSSKIHVLLGCYRTDKVAQLINTVKRPLDILENLSSLYLIGTEELKVVDSHLRSLININDPRYVLGYGALYETRSIPLYGRESIKRFIKTFEIM